MAQRESYSIEIAGIKRELPLFEIKPGLRIAILNILGDTELVQASGRELAKKLKGLSEDELQTISQALQLLHPLFINQSKETI